MESAPHKFLYIVSGHSLSSDASYSVQVPLPSRAPPSQTTWTVVPGLGGLPKSNFGKLAALRPHAKVPQSHTPTCQ